MSYEEIMNEISELEREIAILPIGSIAKKRIKDKEYFYHRISQNGKRSESYIAFEEVDTLRRGIEKRRSLEKRLREYYRLAASLNPLHNDDNDAGRSSFHTMVRTGERLEAQISPVKKLKQRECIKALRNYVLGENDEKVFVIYGLRRTGKTTMIRQILSELPPAEFNKAAFIQISSSNTLGDLDEDMRLLEKNGYKYLFIDEVTLLEDFLNGAALFADIYASSGMKIVLSGTDSLGFAISKEEQLYDRCIMLHTTFIPYREFEDVLGIAGIDEYIRYGGTMSMSGVNYNDTSPFINAESTEKYIDTAIAKNIQHSLRLYEDGGHFRALLDLYERDELTNVINRVIENINHSFTKQVIEESFKSHDISLTAANMLRDKAHPMNIKKHMDVEEVTNGIKDILDIIDREEQSVDINEAHMLQIEEYLRILDLFTDIDVEYMPESGKRGVYRVLTQPGLRYAQAEAIVENLIYDDRFNELSAVERKTVFERLLSEIRGRMMEEIVLLETKLAKPNKKVFKLQFAIGEFDMVVWDRDKTECEIYEIKHSKERSSEQYRHLVDEDKCALAVHRFGNIVGRFVIYRGEEASEDGVRYLNVEKYLLNIGKSK